MFKAFEVNFKERSITGIVDEETTYHFISIPLTVMTQATRVTNLDAFYNDVLSNYMHLIERTGKALEEYKRQKAQAI